MRTALRKFQLRKANTIGRKENKLFKENIIRQKCSSFNRSKTKVQKKEIDKYIEKVIEKQT